MARPRNDDKRQAILAAASRTIAGQGLGVSTATIAREAGVSNGALFTYFATKAVLMDQLYRHLKAVMAAAATIGIPTEEDMHGQLHHVWTGWLRWATTHRDERRALAHLAVSNDVTAASHQAASEAYAEVEALLDRSRANGPLRNAPLMFVASLVTGIVDATVDHMIRDTTHADAHAADGFAALLRVVGTPEKAVS